MRTAWSNISNAPGTEQVSNMFLISSSLLRKKGSSLAFGPDQKIRRWPERPERKYQLPQGQYQLLNTCLFTHSLIYQRFTEHVLCAEHYTECLEEIKHGPLPPSPHYPIHTLPLSVRPQKVGQGASKSHLPCPVIPCCSCSLEGQVLRNCSIWKEGWSKSHSLHSSPSSNTAYT